jgi:hypothetical protein
MENYWSSQKELEVHRDLEEQRTGSKTGFPSKTQTREMSPKHELLSNSPRKWEN